MHSGPLSVQGAGLGLRRAFIRELADQSVDRVHFWEIAPENWMNVGGYYGEQFRALTQKFPFICHGLSLSIGSPSPLDKTFLQQLKKFLQAHCIDHYSEHLSYCSDDGHLYDLMPIPFTEEAVHYVAQRIRKVQQILERRIAIENVSYYAAPGKNMEEIDFLNAVLDEADCDLLLDINNIYVNSVNHHYDAKSFLEKIPVNRIRYLHVAGHYTEAEDLLIDTHGSAVIDPVWQLLEQAYRHFGVIPTVLERDFNIPPLATLLDEVNLIHMLQEKYQHPVNAMTQHG